MSPGGLISVRLVANLRSQTLSENCQNFYLSVLSRRLGSFLSMSVVPVSIENFLQRHVSYRLGASLVLMVGGGK